MAERRVFGKYGPRLTFKCNEGNMTIVTIDTVQGEIPGPTFADPVENGMYVTLDGDMQIAPYDGAADTVMLGKVVGKPQFKGQQPTESANWGDYEPRIVTVEVMGSKVDMVKLANNSKAIVAGQSVTPDAVEPQAWKLNESAVPAAEANNTLALVGAEADSEDIIPVLFNWYGNFG